MSKRIIAFPKTRTMLKKLETTHEEYLTHVANICSWDISVRKVSMPSFNFPPENLDEIMAAREKIVVALDVWDTEIFKSLWNLPENVDKYVGRLFDDTLEAQEYVGRLRTDTDSADYKSDMKRLLRSLEDMGDDVEDMQLELADFVEAIKKFQTVNMQDAYNAMSELIEQLEKDEEIDKEKIDRLMKDIHELEMELNNAVGSLAGSCVATGLGIAGIVLGAVLCGGIGGALIGLFLGIPVAISAAYIVLNSIKIDQCKKRIEADKADMNGYEADIAALSEMVDSYSKFMDEVETMKNELDGIRQVWVTVAEETQSMYDWITEHDEQNEIEETEWQDMDDGLRDILRTCKNIVETMKLVDISDLNVSTAEIELGMSSEEVEKAVESAETVSFLEYIKVV